MILKSLYCVFYKTLKAAASTIPKRNALAAAFLYDDFI